MTADVSQSAMDVVNGAAKMVFDDPKKPTDVMNVSSRRKSSDNLEVLFQGFCSVRK